MSTARQDNGVSYIKRILALKTEQDERTEDIKAVYGEAVRAGHDKTAMGQAISVIRRRAAKGNDKVEAQRADVEEYLAAFERPDSKKNAPAAKSVATKATVAEMAPTRARAPEAAPDIDTTIPDFLDRRKQVSV